MSSGADAERRSWIEVSTEDLGGFGQFPEHIFLISVGSGQYAANDATAPDASSLRGLACFISMEEADIYMAMPKGMAGDTVPMRFDDARDIAKSKDTINCLLLFRQGRIIEIHYVC